MTRAKHLSTSPREILPIRGGRDRAPSPALVRARASETLQNDHERIRTVVAVVAAYAEVTRNSHGFDAQWWILPTPLRPAQLAEISGLPQIAVERAIQDSIQSEVLIEDEDGCTINPDVVLEMPLLAKVDFEAVRSAAQRRSVSLPIAQSVVLEIARCGADREQNAVATRTLPEQTLFKKSGVAQAVSALTDAGILTRSGRGNVYLSLDSKQDSPRHKSPPEASPTGSPQTAGQGSRLIIGGVSYNVPAGAEVNLPANARINISIGTDGTSTINVEPA